MSLLAVGAAFAFTYAFRKTLIEWLRAPVPGDFELTTLSPAEPFTTSFTVALYAAIALAIPILIWQIWAFFAPAIEERSKEPSSASCSQQRGSSVAGWRSPTGSSCRTPSRF